MLQKTKWIAGALAAMSLAQPSIAQAQANCVTEREVGAMLIYAAPALIRGVGTKCGAELRNTGFLATQGEALAARYQKREAEVWPLAKTGIFKLIDKKEEVALFKQLPDDALRPVFGALVSQMLVNDMKTADCGKIERALQIMAPLPEQTVGEIAGFVMAVAVGEKSAKKGADKVPVCPYTAAPAGSSGKGAK